MAVSPIPDPEGALAAHSSVPELAISVIIPVYNSAATLVTLHERLTAVLGPLGQSYEIILIDDGSHDASWAGLQAMRARDPQHVVAVQLMRNYGQHNALMCGLEMARGAAIVTIDDDLQNPPEEIPRMVDHLNKSDLDLVYGVPDDRQHAGWRNLGSTIVWHFYRTVFRNPVTPTPFRAMRHQLAKSVMFYDLNFTYLDGLLAWCTSRVGGLEVAHHARVEGKSNYSVSKLLVLAMNLYTNFSLLPLQIVSGLGLVTAFSGFMVGAFYFVQYMFSNIAVPGFASTIVAILMLGGVQLIALGVIGEYLGRLHLNVNRKPQFIVRRREFGVAATPSVVPAVVATPVAAERMAPVGIDS